MVEDLVKTGLRSPPDILRACGSILETVTHAEGATAVSYLRECKSSQQAYTRLVRECVQRAGLAVHVTHADVARTAREADRARVQAVNRLVKTYPHTDNMGVENLSQAEKPGYVGQGLDSRSEFERSETLDRQTLDTLSYVPKTMFSGLPSGERPKRSRPLYASDNDSYRKHSFDNSSLDKNEKWIEN